MDSYKGNNVNFVTKKTFENGIEKISIKQGIQATRQGIEKAVRKRQKIRENKKHDYDKILFELVVKNGYDETQATTDQNGHIHINASDKLKKQAQEIYDTKYALKYQNVIHSMHRAKQNLFDILHNNDFQYFVTFTFSNEHIDRMDDNQTRTAMTQWANNLRKRHSKDCIYVLIPEYHEKGGLHFHALYGNITDEQLGLIDSGKKVIKGRCKGQTIYNVSRWTKGFSTVTRVQDTQAVKFYIVKYLTKGKIDLRFYGKKRFYASQNIQRPQIEKFVLPLYDNEYGELITDKQTKKLLNLHDTFSSEQWVTEYENTASGYTVFKTRTDTDNKKDG